MNTGLIGLWLLVFLVVGVVTWVCWDLIRWSERQDARKQLYPHVVYFSARPNEHPCAGYKMTPLAKAQNHLFLPRGHSLLCDTCGDFEPIKWHDSAMTALFRHARKNRHGLQELGARVFMDGQPPEYWERSLATLDETTTEIRREEARRLLRVEEKVK